MPESHAFKFDVFLSHNAKDKPRVRRLAERLKSAGLRVWLDDWVVQAGDIIALKVDEGLEQSRVLLLCISPAALASGWVALEGSTAVHRDPANTGRRFIPVLLGDCDLPDSLRRYRYVDFREESEAAFAEVLTTCRPGQGARQRLDALADSEFTEGEKRYAIYRSLPGNDPRTKIQLDSAIECFRKAAARRDARAENALGYVYAAQSNSPEDTSEAITWFQRAAEDGEIRAYHNLAKMYDQGPPVFDTPEDKEQAARFYQKSAEAGLPHSQYRLGYYYEQKNPAEAAKWYRRASDQGYPDAMERLATLYQEGLGVEKNEDAARELRLEAKHIRQEHPEAMESRAAALSLGLWGEKVDKAAAQELERKAEQKRRDQGEDNGVNSSWLLYEKISHKSIGWFFNGN